MTEATSQITPPPFRNSDRAPFVYFDNAPAYGVMGGAIEIELTARTLVPTSFGPTTVEIFPIARLRCSPIAAAALMEALRGALEMLKNLQEQTGGATEAAAAGKLN